MLYWIPNRLQQSLVLVAFHDDRGVPGETVGQDDDPISKGQNGPQMTLCSLVKMDVSTITRTSEDPWSVTDGYLFGCCAVLVAVMENGLMR